jgi:hypothetical protein
MLTCSFADSSATCTASPAGCQWYLDEEDSSTSCIIKDANDFFTDFTQAQMVKATADGVCSVWGQSDCYNTCFWDALNENCVASIGNVVAALVLAGFHPGTVTLQTGITIDGTTCSVEVASCTDPNCQVDGTECGLNPLTGLAAFQTACPGNPALGNLEVAMSGANTAAPAMVIISALVGALAIFA